MTTKQKSATPKTKAKAKKPTKAKPNGRPTNGHSKAVVLISKRDISLGEEAPETSRGETEPALVMPFVNEDLSPPGNLEAPQEALEAFAETAAPAEPEPAEPYAGPSLNESILQNLAAEQASLQAAVAAVPVMPLVPESEAAPVSLVPESEVTPVAPIFMDREPPVVFTSEIDRIALGMLQQGQAAQAAQAPAPAVTPPALPPELFATTLAPATATLGESGRVSVEFEPPSGVSRDLPPAFLQPGKRPVLVKGRYTNPLPNVVLRPKTEEPVILTAPANTIVRLDLLVLHSDLLSRLLLRQIYVGGKKVWDEDRDQPMEGFTYQNCRYVLPEGIVIRYDAAVALRVYNPSPDKTFAMLGTYGGDFERYEAV